jgi:Polyketide cyclase / dehydrase and lipid transport
VDVDRSAPVVAHAEADVAASLEAVWELVAGIESWPSWNPDVRRASLEGRLAPGSTFRWKAGPGTIVSTLRNVDRPREIAWTGKTMGLAAVHVYRLEARDGGTYVVSEESWAGLPVRLLRGRLAKTLQSSLEAGLSRLKTAAERTSP